MKLTVEIQLRPNPAQAQAMHKTIARFNEAANWLAGKAFERKLANGYALHHLHYRDLRERFGLSSQMAARVNGTVCAAYKRDKSVCPSFRPNAGMRYDARLMSFKPDDRVSLLTLGGRILVKMKMGAFQRRQLERIKPGGVVFQRAHDGTWFLKADAEYPDPAPDTVTDYVGVDFGSECLATTDSGEHFTGDDVEDKRERMARRRRNLQRKRAKRLRQAKRPKAVNRKKRKLAQKEVHYRRNTNHCIAKKIVAMAKDSGKGIALEDLTHIRSRTRFRKPQRSRMAGWAFRQLRAFVQYKAIRAGVPVVAVDPRDTSRTCAVCGHCEQANRQSQASFRCRVCGHADNADINAARNIRAKAVCQAA